MRHSLRLRFVFVHSPFRRASRSVCGEGSARRECEGEFTKWVNGPLRCRILIHAASMNEKMKFGCPQRIGLCLQYYLSFDFTNFNSALLCGGDGHSSFGPIMASDWLSFCNVLRLLTARSPFAEHATVIPQQRFPSSGFFAGLLVGRHIDGNTNHHPFRRGIQRHRTTPQPSHHTICLLHSEEAHIPTLK